MSALLALWFAVPLAALLAPYVLAACEAIGEAIAWYRATKAMPMVRPVYAALARCSVVVVVHVARYVARCTVAVARALALAVIPNPSYSEG